MQHAHARFVRALALITLVPIGCSPAEKSPAAAAPVPDVVAAGTPSAEALPPRVEKLEPYACGTVERLHTWGGIFAGSQPAADDLRHASANGIRTVVDLRPASEARGFDEAALVAELGMEYVQVPFASAAELSDVVFERARAILRDDSKRPVFLHCHSGNRVGAIWAAFRALDGGLALDAALEEGRAVGMKSPALEARVREYVLSTRGVDGAG